MSVGWTGSATPMQLDGRGVHPRCCHCFVFLCCVSSPSRLAVVSSSGCLHRMANRASRHLEDAVAAPQPAATELQERRDPPVAEANSRRSCCYHGCGCGGYDDMFVAAVAVFIVVVAVSVCRLDNRRTTAMQVYARGVQGCYGDHTRAHTRTVCVLYRVVIWFCVAAAGGCSEQRAGHGHQMLHDLFWSQWQSSRFIRREPHIVLQESDYASAVPRLGDVDPVCSKPVHLFHAVVV